MASPAPTLKYYQSEYSGFCQPVSYIINNYKIPHELITVDLMKGETRTEEYKKINPLHKVPAIVDGDFNLAESNTLMRYLVDSRSLPEYLYPKDAKKRAFVDLYFDWHAANISFVGKYGNAKFGFAKGTLEEAKTTTDKALKEFEDLFLSKHKFVASDEKITLADIPMAFQLSVSHMAEYQLSPRVEEYLANILQEPGLKDSVDQFIKTIQAWLDEFRAQSEAKPATKLEAKPEEKPEAKPEDKTEAKPEVKPEAVAQPDIKPEAEAQPDIKPEAHPEAEGKTL